MSSGEKEIESVTITAYPFVKHKIASGKLKVKYVKIALNKRLPWFVKEAKRLPAGVTHERKKVHTIFEIVKETEKAICLQQTILDNKREIGKHTEWFPKSIIVKKKDYLLIPTWKITLR